MFINTDVVFKQEKIISLIFKCYLFLAKVCDFFFAWQKTKKNSWFFIVCESVLFCTPVLQKLSISNMKGIFPEGVCSKRL